MRLYSYWRSSCSWRVRIALSIKKVDYEYVAVHLVKDGGHQHAQSYREHTPMSQVPTLELDNGTRLSQSMAIMEYLEEFRPERPSLLPKNILDRATVRCFAEIINSGIQPLQNLSVLQQIERTFQGDKISWGRNVIDNGLRALEKMSASEKSPFLVGSHPTIADICLIPQLYNARRFGCQMSNYPRLLEIEDNCQSRLEFQQAHPDQMPDALPPNPT
jgi:maleylpyruvate isomerase